MIYGRFEDVGSATTVVQSVLHPPEHVGTQVGVSVTVGVIGQFELTAGTWVDFRTMQKGVTQSVTLGQSGAGGVDVHV